MNILQVTPFFAPVYGGSAEAPYQLSRELLKMGHRVTVCTAVSRLGEEYLANFPEDTVRTFPVWLSAAEINITPGMAGWARRRIINYDVVHLHNFRTYQNIVILHHAVKKGIPCVLQAHGSLPRIMSKIAVKRLYDR